MTGKNEPTKKDLWDKSYIVIMCSFTLIIAIGTVVIAIGTYRLAFHSVPSLSEDIKNATITPRGRCMLPHPFYGRVTFDGKPASNANVTIGNYNTNEEDSFFTNENGEYLFEAANFPNCWVGGDKIHISACIGDYCKYKELIFQNNNGGTQIDIDN